MKKLFTLILALMLSISTFAQITDFHVIAQNFQDVIYLKDGVLSIIFIFNNGYLSRCIKIKGRTTHVDCSIKLVKLESRITCLTIFILVG